MESTLLIVLPAQTTRLGQRSAKWDVHYATHLIQTYVPHCSFPLMSFLLIYANVLVYREMLQWEVENNCYSWPGVQGR